MHEGLMNDKHWWCLTHDQPPCPHPCSDEDNMHCLNFDIPTFNSLPGHNCDMIYNNHYSTETAPRPNGRT